MKQLDRLQGGIITLFRIVVGLLFACHGAATLFGVFGGAFGSGRSVQVTTWPGGYAALIQLVTGVIVMLGMGTRPAALLASGSMAYAYFSVHQGLAILPLQNGGEAAALFCWSFLLIAVTGAGPWSLDRLLADVAPRRSAPPSAGGKPTR